MTYLERVMHPERRGYAIQETGAFRLDTTTREGRAIVFLVIGGVVLLLGWYGLGLVVLGFVALKYLANS